jgi:hypothetical protein
MLNREAEAGHDVVSRCFWIFWAVAIPLTLVVLGVYFRWMAFGPLRRNHVESSDKKIERGTTAELVPVRRIHLSVLHTPGRRTRYAMPLFIK